MRRGGSTAEDLTEQEKEAGHRGHQCTDIACLFAFFGCLALLGLVVDYAVVNGDFRRLYHGFNFHGELCGVDTNVADKGYLYMCAAASSPSHEVTDAAGLTYTLPVNLDLRYPICVSSCPTSTDTHSQCFQDRTVQVTDSDKLTGTFTESVTYTFQLVADYPSFVLAKGYCMPSEPALYQQAIGFLNTSPVATAITKASMVQDSIVALSAASVIAFVAGYIYLFLMDKFASVIVHGCLLVATLGFGIAGGALVYASQHGGLEKVPRTGVDHWDLIAGCVLLAFSLLFFLVTCCCWHSIQVAIGCVEAACDCIFDMPGMLLQPALDLILRVIVMVVMGTGFALLISCGEVEKSDIQDFAPAGLARQFHHTNDQLKYIFFYLFMCYWMLELLTALAQFVLAYSAQLWFFTEYEDGKKHTGLVPLCRAYFVAITYHMGTLAVGSLLVAVTRLARVILGFIAKQLGGDEEGNKVLSCVAGCCLCCLTCFEQTLRCVNKNAYMDVAINSNNFCEAAKEAFVVIANETAAIFILHGACWVIQLAGVASITVMSTYATGAMITTASVFTDPASDHYIEDPAFVMTLAAGISLVVTIAFMTVFDAVADTILFCYALDRLKRVKNALPSKNFAPPRLKRLLAEHKSD